MGALFGSDSPIFGIEKTRTEEETSARPDPLTTQSNEIRMQQLQDSLAATGGYKGLFGPQTDKLFQLSPQAQQFLQRYQQQAAQPGLTPEQWYNQARANLDPTVQINNAQDILQNIATPQLQNRYAQMGLGRSGALGEGISLAGMQLAQPIALQAQQQQFEIERQRPNVETTMRAASLLRAQQAFGASDFNRQLELANWQRKVGGMTSALNLIPYVAGQDATGTSRTFGNIFWDLMQMTASLAGAVMGASISPQPTPTGTSALGNQSPAQQGAFATTPSVPSSGGSMQIQGMGGLPMGSGGMGMMGFV